MLSWVYRFLLAIIVVWFLVSLAAVFPSFDRADVSSGWVEPFVALLNLGVSTVSLWYVLGSWFGE